ncbi:Tyrosine-protein phosphatase non-receptor type 14 [Araneus ventricosus]|uniref:protein-tyrosine-phosphatase n=1 Tax=Araneus ventricosus TaxID=182803 RepID=A0A4Y2FFK9_ARAVE|nr:Tyrosine-protein phosphatase non-receptor type 14 [Araneus ventricosus]
MPFKLKLKKSRQYNVSSKNLFVLSVELLDNTTVECTLSAQSSGQECLNNVCQRLGLMQPQYFGLRFLSKKGTYWWVELQRPLKRQLDKYAQDSYNLYLGVMFFVSDVNILHDEVTRYHYFLQLKSDILKGKLCCNEEQTILFASYSLQAEFGDHDPERHTTEYLTNFGLLPEQMVQGKENQEAILERVIHSHRSLQGMSQSLAEVYYIMEAQKINGYGLECFAAKDSSGNAIILGVSLMGIYIWYLNNQPAVYFPWDQILNLVHHKRYFGIEHRNSRKVLQSQLEDAHLAKYVWKTCIQQHSFYTKNEGLMSTSPEHLPETRPPNLTPNVPPRKPSVAKVETRSQHTMQESQDSLDGLGVYYTDGRYSERIATPRSGSQLLEGSQKDLSSTNLPSPHTSNLCLSGSSQNALNQPTFAQNCTSAPSLCRTSSSDTSLHRSQVSVQEGGGQDTKPIGAVLPMYRQAPDYDTAVRLKYGIQSCSTGDMSTSHLLQSLVANGSQVDMPTDQNQSYSQYKNYADLSHLDNANHNVANPNILLRGPEFVHTYSTPDLHSPAGGVVEQQVLYHFKPPPPYPYKQRSSSSTPDLTRNSCVAISQSSAASPRRQSDINPTISYEPVPISGAKIVTSNPIQHQTIASSQRVHSHTSLPTHSYENYNPLMASSHPIGGNQPLPPVMYSSPPVESLPPNVESNVALSHGMYHSPPTESLPSKADAVISKKSEDGHLMGPMLIAAMNGLSLSRPSVFATQAEETRIPNDTRIHALESRLAEGQVFLEFERIPKRKPNADFSTALLPENASRNRFKDVFPYEESRVRLTPTSENRTGYINASHLSVSLGTTQRFYIAAQGPLPNTLYSFWQMIWEHNVLVIVMLTEVQEQGRDKCFPYWPQENGSKLQIGEFQLVRNFSMSSATYVTCSLTLCHVPSQQQRSLWHIQYTDWPDHSCPQDTQGFIAFMNEVDAVRRHSLSIQEVSPVVVHCSAGVGRSGAVILTDIMLFCLDHNLPVDLPKALTHLRFQRMLTVQTLAQYKFVYSVLIEYLKNSRLI